MLRRTVQAVDAQRRRSGVFAQHIQSQGVEAEQTIIRNAKLGLASIGAQSMRKLRSVRALSMKNVVKPSAVDEPGRRRKRQDESSGRAGVSQAVRLVGRQRIDALHKAWALTSFVDSLYVLWMVPYRLGFLFDPWPSAVAASEWTLELFVLTVLDVVGCMIRAWTLRQLLRLAIRRVATSLLGLLVLLTCAKWTRVARLYSSLTADVKLRSRSSLRLSVAQSQSALNLIQREGTIPRRVGSVRGIDHQRQSVTRSATIALRRSRREAEHRAVPSWRSIVALVANCAPWEVIAAFASGDNNLLHVVGVLRLLQAYANARTQFSAVVMPTFSRWRPMQVLSFSTVATTAYLFAVGIYLSHVAACGYMLVAHVECGLIFSRCSKSPIPEAWVLRDNLERASQLRLYARTLYWACKTVVTLGQGDLIPVTLVETAYRVCVQFASGLWATAIVTAYSFYFTHKDANMATNISTQLIQTKKFLRSREVSPELSTAVCAYFYYMERTRSGVEEALILSNLPPHYRSQCSNYVKFKCFSQIPIFRNRQGAFLRTILGLLESDFFTPDQTVIGVGEKEEMLILSSGSVRIVDVKAGGSVAGRLTAGTSYAEYALFEDHVALNQLVSDSFCELWRLPRRSFEMAVDKHFTAANALDAVQMSRSASSGTPSGRDMSSLAAMQASARMIKLAGRGSALMKAFARKNSGSGHHFRHMPVAVTWRHAQSRFRRVWVRVECVLLLWLLWEVPYHIAFQRGFGLLSDYGVHPNTGAIPVSVQRADFFFSLLIELFFLADLALRAFVFVRAAAVDDLKLEISSDGNALATTVTDPTTPTAASSSTTTSAPVAAVASGRAGWLRLAQEKRAAFRRFLDSDPGSWLDVAANLPISLVWDILPKEAFPARIVQIGRFARLLRLLRARQLRRQLKTIMVELEFAPAQRMLAYIVVLCVAVANLAGCLFFLSGDAVGFRGGLPEDGVPLSSISWQLCLEAASVTDNCTWYMFDRSTFDIDAPYLRSLHWSIVLLSTVGYGDVVAFSTVECIVACVWIFLGANICYLTSSALSSVLDQFSIVGLLRDERAEELNVALAGMPTVSDATKQAIRSYFEMKWKLNGSTMTSSELAHRLPRSLRRHLFSSLYLTDFLRCVLFADCSEHDEFVRQLALVTASEIFLKKIVVAREGHLATEFFLIQSGECECLLPAVRAPLDGRALSLGSTDAGGLRWPLGTLPPASSPFKVAAAVTSSTTLWAGRKWNRKRETMLVPTAAPSPAPTASFTLRKPSWTSRHAVRSTFSGSGSAVPDHVQLLKLQKEKSSLFRSAVNLLQGPSIQSDEPLAVAPDSKHKSVVASQKDKLQKRLLDQQPRLSPHWRTPSPSEDTPSLTRAVSPRKDLVQAARASETSSAPSAPLSPMLGPPLRPRPTLSRHDTLRSVASASTKAAPATPVPVLMLKPSDYFGEESLLGSAELYDITVRVVSSAVQVAVVRRADFLAVAARFPQLAARVQARNQAQRVLDRRLLQTHRINFVAKPKISKFFFGGQSNSQGPEGADGSTIAASVEAGEVRSGGLTAFVLDPEGRFATWWRRAIRVVLMYNFFAISFRVAFLPHPKPHTMLALSCIDYLTDTLFLVDLFLKYGHMGYVELGEKVMDPTEIRRRYRQSWLWADCVSMLPLYLVTGGAWTGTPTRVPRLIRSVHLVGITHDTQTYIQEHYLKGSALFSSLFDLAKFFLIFLSTAHYVSCAYYLLGRLQLETGLADRSWVSDDPILRQHPRSPTVHYMRAFYWCLSTFTVDCFGDIWARNFLETLFAMLTCALGWIFIGQVIGRINALMITLDKDRKQRNDRVEHFQQYAKQRRLPEALRLRALEGLAFKSECSVALRLRDTLRDLPSALRAGLCYELYGPVLHSVPELLGGLAPVHLEALSSALYLEIYLHGDVVYEAGRRGNRLYLLQDGLVEVYSALSSTIYARLEAGSSRCVTEGGTTEVGALFGEFAFFLRGARRLTSVRAVRSCQVLQLERSAWARLWPRDVRLAIERALLPRVQHKYRDTARAFLNIDKNLFVRSDAPLPALTANGLETATVIAQECSTGQAWGRRPPRPRLSFEYASQRPPRPSFNNPRASRRRSTVALASPAESGTLDVVQVRAPTSTSEAAARLAQAPPKSAQGPPPATQATLARRLTAKKLLRANSLNTPVETMTQGAEAPPVVLGSMRRLLPDMLTGSGRRLSVPDTDDKPAPDSPPRTGRATPPGAMLSPSRRSFAVSSMLVEIRWKRHEKRLRALQLFAFSWGQIEKNLASTAPQRTQRRRSITIARGLASVLRRPAVPGGSSSIDDGQIHLSSTLPVSSEVIEAARRGSRRHSLLVVRSDLDSKFALADVAVPLLAARITAHLRLESRASASARRRSAFGGISNGRVTSGRRASSVNQDDDALYTEANDFGDTDGGSIAESVYQEDAVTTGSWLGDLFRPLRSIASSSTAKSATVTSSKVAPAPVTPVADAPRSSVVLATATLPPLPSQLTGVKAPRGGAFDVNSKFRRLWSGVMLAVTVYHISITPYRVSFMDGFLNDLSIEPLVGIWFALELALVDLAFLADFVLKLRFFAFVDRGETISEPQAIAAHYRRHGSFLLDLVSILPLELLLLGAAPLLGLAPAPSVPDQWPLFHSPSGGLVNWHTVAFLKLNRFLRVVHVHSLSDEIQRALLYESKLLAALQLRPGVLYLARLALDFLLGTHWLACIFFGVSYINFQDGDVSWLTTPGMLTTEGCAGLRDIRRVPVSAAYLRSFHFSIGAITTVCYGDILPMNAVENAATLAVILVSVLLFSFLSGGFFKFFAMELGTRAEFEERVAQVGHFMTLHDFPSNMWTQMKVYFALSWQESKGMHEEQQLRGLPTTLRQDIARHVHANLIQHVRLFHSCEEPFSKAIIAAIKHEFFVRNDVIIQRGDMERSLYIVETGLIVISAVRKKKSKAAAGGIADTRMSSMTALNIDAEADGDRRSDRQKASGADTSETPDHENDSVNEWLTLSRQLSKLTGTGPEPPSASKCESAATIKPRRREASVVGVVSAQAEGSGPPGINLLTEREERIVKGPFEYFGERSLLFGTPRNATCVAACVSSLFVLTSDRFDAILDEFPSYRSKVVRAWVMTRRQPTDEAAPTPAKTASMLKR